MVSLNVHRALALGLLVCWSLPMPSMAQEVGTQPPAGGRGLSPETIDAIISGTQPDTPATVTVANRPVVVFRATVLRRSSIDRAAAAERVIGAAVQRGRPISVGSRAVGPATVITLDSVDAFAIVPADADELVGETVQSKTEEAVARLQQAIDETLDAGRPAVLLQGIARSVAATILFALIVWALSRLRRAAIGTAERASARTQAASRMADEILQATRVALLVRRLVTVVVMLTGLIFAYFWVTFVLRSFPFTRPWGEELRGYLIDRLIWFATGFTKAIPAIFTIVLIALATRFMIKLTNFVFKGAEEGRFTVPGIYPETVAPTRKLVTGLLWLFALVVCYPYLPGSETDAFKGVSVFVGLMISLGSSGLVNQVMSGLTVTYSRALRVGDFVRTGDIEGTVIQIGTLSTKVETARREEITIPNQVLVSQTVTNFSRNADGVGVYTPTSVTIGYDAPWRQVRALLLRAAEQTAGVRPIPAPTVLQAGLEESYVRYTLLVALEDQKRRGPILDQLHANIQDAFNEHGVQIMTPGYEGDPDSPKIVPKERWFAEPAAPPKPITVD
jgi:small-conductance mechanosensitive channel